MAQEAGTVGDAAAAPADVSRAAARLTTDYLLRMLRLITEVQKGDLITALVGQAIIAANTSYLRDAADPDQRYASLPELPPDAVRRPISVRALSGWLGLPFETTRRHVNKLIAAGACRKVRGGVIIPAEALDTPQSRAATETSLRYTRQYVKGLLRLGLSLD